MTTTRPDPASVFTADELEGLVLVQRFASIRQATTDPAAAVALYAWNARVSGAFAELIQHVEVLVRNAMHRRLTAHHAQVSGRPPGKAWFDEPSWVRHHWFNKADRVKIRSAIGRAGHTSYRPDPGKVIAALNFGFWRYLASARYEQSLWVPALDNAFTAPGRDFGDRRRAVEHRLAYLHLLRNRISHCEPIIGPLRCTLRGMPEVAKTLEQIYSEATELVSFISPAAAAWLEHETRNLPRLLDDRP